MNKSHRILVGASACIVALALTACGNSQNSSNEQHSVNKPKTEQVDTGARTSMVASSHEDHNLAKLNYAPGTNPWKNVNHDKSTLDPNSWKYDHINYANLDGLNRTSKGNTAYLDHDNLAKSNYRTRQVVKPTGWHQKFINGSPVINRGHEIAYSLSGGINQNGQHKSGQVGDQNNPKNLFTQSAFSNQKVQTVYENMVRKALQQNKKVIYQVTPIFQGKDLMAKGVHMQAMSTDKSLNFNVYLFNVQSGIKFNYANGRSTIDNNMSVITPRNAPTFANDNYRRNTNYYNRNYGYGRHHHLVRHAIEGYMLYRIGRHMGERRARRAYYEPRSTYTHRIRVRPRAHHFRPTYHPTFHSHSTFGHSTFGHSSFGHSSFHSHPSFHFHSRL